MIMPLDFHIYIYILMHFLESPSTKLLQGQSVHIYTVIEEKEQSL